MSTAACVIRAADGAGVVRGGDAVGRVDDVADHGVGADQWDELHVHGHGHQHLGRVHGHHGSQAHQTPTCA